MSHLLDLRCNPEDAEGLLREIERRNKIISSLMYQVEQSLNTRNTDYGLLQNTFMLEGQVRARTEELKKSVEALEAFMANANVGILFTHNRTMLRHNHSFAEIFGFSGQEAIGQPARILFRSDEDYSELGRQAGPVLSAAQPFNTELYMRRQDGTELWINMIGYVSDIHDTNQGTIWLLEDRTAFKVADQALRRSHEQLEERVAERTSELSQQLHFVKQMIEAIPGPVFFKDAQARYLGCNSAFEALVGRPSNELIGMTAHDIAPAELADKYLAVDQELFEHPGVQVYESLVRYANGDMRDVMFHKATFTNPDGGVGGVVGLMLDITDRKQMENNLRQAATVFESSAEGVIITSPDGSIIAANPAFTEITGYEEHEVIGQNPRFLQSGRHSKNFYREMWGSIFRDGRWQGELWNRRKNGEIYPESLSIAVVRNKNGRISSYVSTFSDITQQKKNEERIRQLAFSDPLTNLPNRRLLLDRLQHAIATSSRNKRQGALFFIDLDDFKDLNDTRGHEVGDQLLQQVAERLVMCVREGDTVARFGGDEFVVMLEGLSEKSLDATTQVKSTGEKILAALNEPYFLEGGEQRSTPSIGVTLFGNDETSMDELLKQADLAMYQAKGSGRNALRFFDPEMQTAVSARVSLEADLRLGILGKQFTLHYQPQLDQNGQVIGAEALVRWSHPTRGLIPPIQFIPLAEETGLILPLGLQVLETACEQLSIWARKPETAHLTLAVNVSAHQFHQAGFVSQVLTSISTYGTNPRKLKLEITESLLLDDVKAIIAKMTALKEVGVGFALDDFGTGYSSLSYLKRLPLDQLKIDQSFVREILVDTNDAAIARTIVALAQAMGLGVIAEGVETEEQLYFLSSIGCHSYQGYLFSRPVPLDEFELLLTGCQ